MDWWIVPGVVVGLAALLLTTAYVCYRLTFAVPKKYKTARPLIPKGGQYDEVSEISKRLVDEVMAIPCEEISIKTKDGLTLFGRYYEKTPGAPVDIMFHGYRSSSLLDFSGGVQLVMECGCNAIMVDQRSHGRSDGRCLSFGISERHDLVEWVNYAVERFGKDVKIVLSGMSMGAATVLMASELDLPENVVGIFSDCGYSSPREIIRKVLRDMKLPVGPTYFMIRLGARLFGGFDPDSASAESALANNSRIPVLFIHGEDDRFVPCEMSRRNYDACRAEKRLLTVKNAGHGLSYLVDYESYSQAVKEFLSKAHGAH